MSVPKHVEEAAEAIWKDYHYSGSKATAELSARALDAAGLLRTGLEQRAVEACEAYAGWKGSSCANYGTEQKVWEVGRESLAARKPVPRWGALRRTDADGWVVADNNDARGSDVYTELQARAIVQTLNNLEA